MADYDDLPQIIVERRGGGFAAFVWGALIGAGAALLLAPRSGRETREELRKGVDRLRNTAEDTARQVRNAVNETVQDVRGDIEERIDSARHAVEAGRNAARETRASLERRLRDSKAAVEVGLEAGIGAARREHASREETTPADEADESARS